MSKLLERIKQSRQAIEAKKGRERPVKLGSQKNLVRILPNWKGEEDGEFSQEFGQHFIKDKAGNIQAVYICTATTFGDQCPVCAEIARHSTEVEDEDMVRVLSEARSSSRILVNAIYMNGSHPNAKTEPVLLELPPSVFGDVLGIAESYLEDFELNIFDLEGGYDLVITKSGSGRETRYNVTPAPKPRAIPADVLQKARDLNAYAKQEYDAGLQKALTSLNAVMGGRALPAPGGNKQIAQDKTESSSEKLANTAPVDMSDMEVIDGDFKEVEAPTPTTVENKKAANTEPTVDDDLAELDALLEEMGDAA